MRYLLINKKTTIIENAIEWDGNSKYEPEDPCYLVQSDQYNIGDKYPVDIEVSSEKV